MPVPETVVDGSVRMMLSLDVANGDTVWLIVATGDTVVVVVEVVMVVVEVELVEGFFAATKQQNAYFTPS